MVYVDKNGNCLDSVDLSAGYVVDRDWIDHPAQKQKGHYVYSRNSKGGIVQTYVIDQEARGSYREVTVQTYIPYSTDTTTCDVEDGVRMLCFLVSGQYITSDPSCDFSGLVPGSEGYLRASFKFDGDWDGCKKAASFFDSKEKEHAVPLVDGTCMIPEDALTGRVFHVSVTGARKGFRIKTNKIMIRQGG